MDARRSCFIRRAAQCKNNRGICGLSILWEFQDLTGWRYGWLGFVMALVLLWDGCWTESSLKVSPKQFLSLFYFEVALLSFSGNTITAFSIYKAPLTHLTSIHNETILIIKESLLLKKKVTAFSSLPFRFRKHSIIYTSGIKSVTSMLILGNRTTWLWTEKKGTVSHEKGRKKVDLKTASLLGQSVE